MFTNVPSARKTLVALVTHKGFWYLLDVPTTWASDGSSDENCVKKFSHKAGINMLSKLLSCNNRFSVQGVIQLPVSVYHNGRKQAKQTADVGHRLQR